MSDFLKDMKKVTDGKTDKVLSKTLTSKSFETIHWLSKRFEADRGSTVF